MVGASETVRNRHVKRVAGGFSLFPTEFRQRRMTPGPARASAACAGRGSALKVSTLSLLIPRTSSTRFEAPPVPASSGEGFARGRPSEGRGQTWIWQWARASSQARHPCKRRPGPSETHLANRSSVRARGAEVGSRPVAGARRARAVYLGGSFLLSARPFGRVPALREKRRRTVARVHAWSQRNCLNTQATGPSEAQGRCHGTSRVTQPQPAGPTRRRVSAVNPAQNIGRSARAGTAPRALAHAPRPPRSACPAARASGRAPPPRRLADHKK